MNYIQEAERYLRYYRDLHRSLETMKKERSRLVGKSAPKGYGKESGDVVKTDIPKDTSHQQDDTYNQLFKIKTLSESIKKTEQQLQEVDKLLEDISKDPGCELYGDILKKWYIEKIPKEDIAQEAKYCQRNIYKIKDKAIRKLAVNLFGLDAMTVLK